ncbi:MAG: site-specific integrase [Gammaproteobacteria bacterium]|nr:site-specific integrase [Gammaproteobacteria bacterium]
MTKKHSIPRPIFDTLAHLSESLNQETNTALIFAKHDLQLAFEFLKQYDGNETTFKCYRREIERLIQWSWLLQEKSIAALRRDDIEAYINFCIKPPKSWIALQVFPRFRIINDQRLPNPHWRPFVITRAKNSTDNADKTQYKISQKTIREIFVALGSFFNFLNTENYIEQNPVLAIKQKSKFIRKTQTKATIRRLSDLQWKMVINTAQELAEINPDKYARTLFIISALYLMYLRVSELVESDRWSPQMNHFYQDSYQNWWFKTVGKGNKERSIAVNDDMLLALKVWRQYLGLFPALPSPDDNYPLIPKLRGKGNITDTKSIYLIVQDCFNLAATKLHASKQHEEADNLINASSHWLRHTGISDSINKFDRPIAHVRDDAGHASISTTDRYNDITLLERHNSARKGKLEH